ncbi:UpxZ family transcription anti-terminator antagonist [Bacteroides fragilis]|nr:UpxZ family transcription anti-terminator antagonist [Bacteroides fragilis]
MNTLTSQIEQLQSLAHELLYLGVDGAPIYTDHEEEANICLALLMGYNATIYNQGDKEEKKQVVLNRCWDVLDQLPATLLKCQLLTYCYGEVFEEELAKEAHTIIESWSNRELLKAEKEIAESLNNLEANPYPYSELHE